MTASADAATTWPTHVGDTASFVRTGMTEGQVRALIRARRWVRHGKAVVPHNGPLTLGQRRSVVLVNAGPRAVLTAFTALDVAGLPQWRRAQCHVLVPEGARVRRLPEFDVAVHRSTRWPPERHPESSAVHATAPAVIVAVAHLPRARAAVALVAAAVQHRMTTVGDLRSLVEGTPNLRHRRLLLASLDDIAMGAEALSEIDFAVLCRRAGLAEPVRQAVRLEPGGRRRYLDAEWTGTDGRRVVAEVDGAHHLVVENWWQDMSRQNEVAIARSTVLRFPAVAVREGDPLVVDQLRRAGVPSIR